jgi:mono/diheme cytochrome c family protein
VAFVLRDNCIRCHGQPPLSGVPFSLLSWEDLDRPWGEDAKVRDVALRRVTSTAADRMPPRPADPLGPAQIDAIARWLEAGAPPGENPACLLR